MMQVWDFPNTKSQMFHYLPIAEKVGNYANGASVSIFKALSPQNCFMRKKFLRGFNGTQMQTNQRKSGIRRRGSKFSEEFSLSNKH